MSRFLKKIVIGVLALLVLVGVATVIYTKFYNQADAEFSQDDVNERLDSPDSTDATISTDGEPAASGSCADGSTATSTAATSVDGRWIICGDSEVGYRINEVVNGLDKVANGRTKEITGSIDLTGTTATRGEFSVDMATFSSDESRRDNQFNGRIMEVSKFPTATFVLTAPIDFQQIPAEGGTVAATATGDLTLHGVTRSVTFELSATFKNGLIGILGQIPITFSDYDIENPSFGTVTTEDHGLLEFVLILGRA